jgi:polysaccharide biosynthesis transport protein
MLPYLVGANPSDGGPDAPRGFVAGGPLILEYVRVVYRHRWVMAAIWLAVVLGVGAYTYTRVPVFEAHATMLIESEEPNVVKFEKVLDEGGTDYYQTQYQLLESKALAQQTVTALDLAANREFSGGSDAGAVAALRAGLRITPVRGSRMVDIRFRSTDPELAARIANAHARAYIEQNLEHRFVMSTEATEWLDKQLAEERQRVHQTESALQAFREQNDAVSLKEGQDIVVQKLADLNGAVTRAKTNRIEKEAQHRAIVAARNDLKALDSFPAILENAFIQQLKGNLATLQREDAELSEVLGDQHPTLLEKRSALATTERRLNAEISRVVDSVERAFQAARAEETSLMQALEQQKREALTLNKRGIEYAALEREAESIRQVYQSLLQRAKETGVSRELRATNIRIVDPAEVPGRPVTPRRAFNLLMSILLGGFLAFGGTFLIEALDDRIKSPDEVRGELGLAFVGVVPEVKARREGGGPLLEQDVPSSFAEAVRSMRTSVVMSADMSKTSRIILVASAGQGEGKTLVACNLAVALARAQQSVLLIDADMRRPGVHTMLDQPMQPGLSELLDGTAALAEAMRPSTVPGLTVIAAGSPSASASELLGSHAYEELLTVMGEHFPWVIIDSPPVLSVTDATVIAQRTSGILFVVGSGMTRTRAARLAVEELQQAGGRVVGAVLNRADLEHHPYYFSAYSRGQYPVDGMPDAARPHEVGATLFEGRV